MGGRGLSPARAVCNIWNWRVELTDERLSALEYVWGESRRMLLQKGRRKALNTAGNNYNNRGTTTTTTRLVGI